MATVLNPFLNVRSKVGDSEKSLAWYQTQVKALAAAATKPSKLMQNAPDLTTRIMPGNLYMFFYDPKLKVFLLILYSLLISLKSILSNS